MAELQKREKMMLGATGGFLVAFILYQFVFTSDEAPPETPRKNVAQKVQPISGKQTKDGNVQVKMKPAGTNYAAMNIKSWGRDPFREAYRLAILDTAQVDSAKQLLLKGIIWKDNRALVLINDRIMRKGERMGDIKVLDIKKDLVICRQGNNTITLFLDDEK